MTEEAQTGRPTLYTEDLVDEICDRLTIGESMVHICRDDHMPNCSTVFRWLGNEDHEAFCKRYTRARETQADFMAAEILDISDNGSNDWMEREGKDGEKSMVLNGEHIQRSRLRVDTRKFLMAKLQPKKYGDKLNLGMSGDDGEPITAIQINIVDHSKKG